MSDPSTHCTVMNRRSELPSGPGWNVVLDSTADPSIPGYAVGVAGMSASLYSGEAARDYHDIAPYLLPADREVTDWIRGHLALRPWGVLLQTAADSTALRTHLRRLLTVKSPRGEPWIFRWYDPRVLPRFLAVCTRAEISFLFGPIEALICPRGDELIELRPAPTVYETGTLRVRLSSRWTAPPAATNLFQLRPEHLEPFEPDARTALVDRIVAHLSARHPMTVADLPDAEIRRRIAIGLSRAIGLGANEERALTVFVTLMFTVSARFFEQPDIRARLLDATAGDPNARILALPNRTTAWSWSEAERLGFDWAAG